MMTEKDKEIEAGRIWKRLNGHPHCDIDREQASKKLSLGINILIENDVFHQQIGCWNKQRTQGDVLGGLGHIFFPKGELQTVKLSETIDVPLSYLRLVNEIFNVAPPEFACTEWPSIAFAELYSPAHYYRTMNHWFATIIHRHMPWARHPVTDKILEPGVMNQCFVFEQGPYDSSIEDIAARAVVDGTWESHQAHTLIVVQPYLRPAELFRIAYYNSKQADKDAHCLEMADCLIHLLTTIEKEEN